jgi:uncharacterized UBP type Zn finger protein
MLLLCFIIAGCARGGAGQELLEGFSDGFAHTHYLADRKIAALKDQCMAAAKTDIDKLICDNDAQHAEDRAEMNSQTAGLIAAQERQSHEAATARMQADMQSNKQAQQMQLQNTMPQHYTIVPGDGEMPSHLTVMPGLNGGTILMQP